MKAFGFIIGIIGSLLVLASVIGPGASLLHPATALGVVPGGLMILGGACIIEQS